MSQDQLQFFAALADYEDRAFEIEVESELNAAKIKRQLIRDEKSLLEKQHASEMKLLNQNMQVSRSKYISESRQALMEKTKAVFDEMQKNASKAIQARIARDPAGYKELLDALIIKGSQTFQGKAILSVAAEDQEYVSKKLADYTSKTGLQYKLGKQLEAQERGVKIFDESLKICVNSTLEQRLMQAMHTCAPELNATVLPDVQLIE